MQEILIRNAICVAVGAGIGMLMTFLGLPWWMGLIVFVIGVSLLESWARKQQANA